MVLHINAICVRGIACENNEDLVTIGGISLRNGIFSREVEFTGSPAYPLLIADGMGSHEEGDMGCSPAGVVWAKDTVWIINDGNSRIYLFRDGIVEQLTVDENTEDSLLTNFMGFGRDKSLVATDITDKIEEGDILLICSGCLGDVVNSDYLEYFLINSVSPAEDLAEWAMENGSTGNISVIAARVGGGEFGYSDDFMDDDGRFDAWV